MKGTRVTTSLLRPFRFLIRNERRIDYPIEEIGPLLLYQDIAMKDPIYYNEKMTVDSWYEFIDAGKSVRKQSKKMTTPFMIYHGLADTIVYFELIIGMSVESREILKTCTSRR